MRAVVLAAIWMIVSGCGREPDARPDPSREAETNRTAAAPLFERFTPVSGVEFVHHSGTNYFMPDQIASGIVCLDYNCDGILDLYLVQYSTNRTDSGNRLYRGKGGGRFEDVSKGSGADVIGLGMGAIAGDMNNDGFPDLVVTEYGATRILQNIEGKQFREITSVAGVDNPRWAVPASFIDFDRDGWLDLVVGNYLDYDPSEICHDSQGRRGFCGPSAFQAVPTRLWRNKTKVPGEMAAFEDWTVQSGLSRHPGVALGLICADLTGDRWPDIFCSDDGRPNRLFVNQRNGTFTEEAAIRGLAYDAMGRTAANMGVVWADLNQDGHGDLFVTHLTEEFHSLFQGAANGVYMDRIAQSGVLNQEWRGTGFGTVGTDFNLDGWVDLAIVNGLVQRSAAVQKPLAAGVSAWWGEYAQRHQLFLSERGVFRDVSASNSAFSGEASVGRSLAMADLDEDGAMDLILGNADGPVELYRNVAPRAGHWLKVRLVESALGGRDAIGAEIRLKSRERSWWGVLQPATSYLASHEPVVHFGLGSATAIDAAEVVWASGEVELFGVAGVDRMVILKKGEGTKP